LSEVGVIGWAAAAAAARVHLLIHKRHVAFEQAVLLQDN